MIRAIILGVVFGASSLYLVLKVGLTISASIPVAVISLALFRVWSKFGGRDATVLENNIVQTAGSAGESIAFSLGVTMPAIMILGFDLEITRVMLVVLLRGLLGILMMIPLRRALIVAQNDQLKYPEGTACAEVLRAGADADSRALAAGGIISLLRSLPTILHGIRAGMSDFSKTASARASALHTERDLSMRFVAGGVGVLILRRRRGSILQRVPVRPGLRVGICDLIPTRRCAI